MIRRLGRRRAAFRGPVPIRVGRDSALSPRRARHRLPTLAALDILPLGTLYVDQRAERGIARPGEAAYRVEQRRIDPSVAPYRRVDMRVHDAAEHDVGV